MLVKRSIKVKILSMVAICSHGASLDVVTIESLGQTKWFDIQDLL